MAPPGGKPASNPPGQNNNPPSNAEVYVAAFGLSIVLVATLVVVWFYGSGSAGETSAVGVLGVVFTVVGSIVGTVFGVSAGTKSGAAGGQVVARDAKQLASKVLTGQVETLKDIHTTSRMTSLAASPGIAPLQVQIQQAILKTQQAIELLS